MEVLNTAFNYLVKSIKHRPDSHIIPSKADENGQYNYAVYNGLTHSISGLAKHIYYANQVNDIIGYIVAKLRPQTSLKDVDGIAIGRYRQCLLQCLCLVIEKCSKEVDHSATKPLISLDVLVPALSLLSDDEEGWSSLLYDEMLEPALTLSPSLFFRYQTAFFQCRWSLH
jgi:hypothetical protein